MEQCVFLFPDGLCFSDRGILPREDPGVLAQVQVQERVGVLIAGTQSLRERDNSWNRERGGGGGGADGWKEKERGRQDGGGSCTILKDREHYQNILCPYIIHTHLQRQQQQQVSVDVTGSRAEYLPASI